MSSQPLFPQGYILGRFSVHLPLLTFPQFREERPFQPPPVMLVYPGNMQKNRGGHHDTTCCVGTLPYGKY